MSPMNEASTLNSSPTFGRVDSNSGGSEKDRSGGTVVFASHSRT